MQFQIIIDNMADKLDQWKENIEDSGSVKQLTKKKRGELKAMTIKTLSDDRYPKLMDNIEKSC